MTFIAHINGNREQTCTEHCRNTAVYAADDLKDIGLKHTAYFAGLLHDCGKFTNEFTEYIRMANSGASVKKGSVIHTFAGVSCLLNRYHCSSIPGFQELTSELIAYAIGSHHGLFDCIDEDSKNGFLHRLRKQPDYEKRAIENFHKECASQNEINRLFTDACEEITGVYTNIMNIPKIKNEESMFYAGMLARLLTSCVIDGDRRDTAEFMSGTDFSKIIKGDKDLWEEAQKNVLQYLSNLPTDSEIGNARKELSDLCCKFADHPSNIYRLNLPTGGGKTLSGLRYALSHALQYGKKRIIYVAPLISILDQNAKIIREAIGSDEIVLEHHSNIIIDRDDPEELNRYQLLAETWDAPIIITTLVQFLNTLFSGKTGCIRRMQSLCNSVIIIDEVQTVPTNMLTLFNLAMNFLSQVCESDILLCSATQPCLEQVRHPMIISKEEAIPSDKQNEYYRIFKRTEIIDAGKKDPEEEIPAFILGLSKNYSSILVICNKKSEAASLFKCIRERTEISCFYLSSGMCMAHRRDVLKQIAEHLRKGIPLICISTQVIEAGVDISFSAGIRLSAGLDNIIQAAGRINRNGESSTPGPLYIIGCVGENLNKLREISEAKNALDELLIEFKSNPESFEGDLSAKPSADYYYSVLYRNMKEGQQDYSIPDKPSVFNLLSENSIAVNFSDKDSKDCYFMHQAFAEAGKLFKVMDDNTETLLVPYKAEGREIIAELAGSNAQFDFAFQKELMNRAKDYSVNIFDYQIKKLEEAGAIRRICDGSVLVLSYEPYYDEEALGLDPEGGNGEWITQIL